MNNFGAFTQVMSLRSVTYLCTFLAVFGICTPWARTSAIPGEWIEYLINITTTIHWKCCISVILASYCTLKLCLSSSPFVNQSICQLKWFPNVLNSDISNPEVIWGITFSVFLLHMYRVVYHVWHVVIRHDILPYIYAIGRQKK